jgi:regulator of telomere elongation helicase 1
LILLPYNYLVDPSIRSTLNVDWRNSVVIFDEAHNLESVASDASSFTLSSVDIAACIKEMQDAVRSLQDLKQLEAPGEKEKPSKTSKSASDERPNIDKCLHILRGLFQLESRIDGVALAMIQSMNKVGKVCPGAWLLELFESCGFSMEMVSTWMIC